jgi:NAD(P)H-hydrate epimerase
MTFVTDTGIRVPAVTAAQMREVDRIAAEETGPNLFQMMENAGRNLAELAIERLGARWREQTIAVLAGPGGNGGGGICAARHLANRGARVLLCLAEPSRLAEVTAYQRKIFESTSGREISPDELDRAEIAFVLDALLGYSLAGAPRGAIADLIRWTHRAHAPVVALDLPSGLDATTGGAPGDVVRADMTLTLALPKQGLAGAGHRAVRLVLADLGIPQAVFRRAGVAYDSPFDQRFRVPLEWTSS